MSQGEAPNGWTRYEAARREREQWEPRLDRCREKVASLEAAPRFVQVPTPTWRCGGDTAWVFRMDGVDLMIGCVCHTDLFAWMRKAALS